MSNTVIGKFADAQTLEALQTRNMQNKKCLTQITEAEITRRG
jgi:hypothetical protein